MPTEPKGRAPRFELPEGATARERRLARLVESFLEHLREGGALDIEPFLVAADELRSELEPLLLGVLRMESYAERFEHRRLR